MSILHVVRGDTQANDDRKQQPQNYVTAIVNKKINNLAYPHAIVLQTPIVCAILKLFAPHIQQNTTNDNDNTNIDC
jgi:hypothetical protein